MQPCPSHRLVTVSGAREVRSCPSQTRPSDREAPFSTAAFSKAAESQRARRGRRLWEATSPLESPHFRLTEGKSGHVPNSHSCDKSVHVRCVFRCPGETREPKTSSIATPRPQRSRERPRLAHKSQQPAVRGDNRRADAAGGSPGGSVGGGRPGGLPGRRSQWCQACSSQPQLAESGTHLGFVIPTRSFLLLWFCGLSKI